MALKAWEISLTCWCQTSLRRFLPDLAETAEAPYTTIETAPLGGIKVDHKKSQLQLTNPMMCTISLTWPCWKRMTLDMYCAMYNVLVDAATPAEVFITETDEASSSFPNDDSPTATEATENSWISLPVNLVEACDDPDKPAVGMYEPAPAWERPAGHAVQGIDAFKIQCHVNSIKEPAVAVIGDSGAVPTLISKDFLDQLKFSKPKPRAGHKLKLLQLTGSARCSEYV